MTATALALADRLDTISVSSTVKVSAEAGRLKREGVDVVDFGAGEPDFPTPDNIKKAAIKALDDNFTKYTPVEGTVDLKKAIVERHATDFGTSYAPNECAATVGGKHIIFNLMQVLVNPGDEVIIPVPYWVTYKDVVNYAGGKCVFLQADEASGFNFTAADVARLITPRTKAVLINSPSNPSGGVLPDSEFIKIFELTSSRGIWLITDECYCRFLYAAKPFSIASMPGAKDTVIVAGSLSKTYSMTGWRIGFGLAPKYVIDGIIKLQSHMTSNPTSIAQRAAIEALRGPQESVQQMLAEYASRRAFVIPRLRRIPGVTVQEPMGAFYAYPNIGGAMRSMGIKTALEFTEQLLKKAHVAAVPGEAFGTDSHIRISYAASMHEISRGLDRIDNFIQGK
ncbi:MAG: pyridoxal phosphate-dependent aminotransferase [Acidobacteria bacterium]|nr:pyridoxal phosphate-dependent aminotransferase [Acidobacteriota bacterium]